jgi:hypothetical protein
MKKKPIIDFYQNVFAVMLKRVYEKTQQSLFDKTKKQQQHLTLD